MRRDDVASTSIRRQFGTICPLGVPFSNQGRIKQRKEKEGLRLSYCEALTSFSPLAAQENKTIGKINGFSPKMCNSECYVNHGEGEIFFANSKQLKTKKKKKKKQKKQR